MSSTVTEQQEQDAEFTSECPYCGEEFVADTKMEADNQEGVHRTEEHVQDGDIERVVDGKNSTVNDWRRKTGSTEEDEHYSQSEGEGSSGSGANKLIKGMKASQDDDDAEVA